MIYNDIILEIDIVYSSNTYLFWYWYHFQSIIVTIMNRHSMVNAQFLSYLKIKNSNLF